MLSPERINILQIQWARLLDRYGVTPAAAYPVFDELLAAYAQPGRYYHTLEHIAEVLKVLSKLIDLAEHPADLMLAAWFHDAVYDPTAVDNEAQSAALARRLLAPLGLSEESLARIETMILATRHGAAESSQSVGDAVLLQDADLSILGSAESRYLRYAADIRREYRHVPDTEYRDGRLRVLQGFLNRAAIYQTERMAAVGEAPARANLEAEIARLHSGEFSQSVDPSVSMP
ncbi:Putative uncharacterized protein OS=Fischerella sp. JSC-11 GN=FJSC11DRAFT_4510 PE=4 SV=1 [Tuwongella immobilis]|uniref:Metal-dependent HD superfamily phosphohydrolase n=2 Tax=Tuwongella immobilis TaxID=692036 RepID=A0A6C2YVQ9_9BACT|nr:hypothetical protein [Tuwongella immobilis]VIP05710.1 Putative uncharacterized protein OS=Fischerella sp. JSC-11 GN=FJSC11DRAFT_4510 PE=4 SV=1 [Tuwongella immobilis]VTS08776.1 Putative uncharacterized protein OS=Fischerella sp. JSC-11 GN=FJSC11DRAFT_4510 PE=4 SV=1 [Tuwongella immobilis]